MSETTTKKRKASLPLLIAGGVSSLVLALGMSPTFSAFTASITNNANSATSGTLIMEETDGVSTPCRSDSVSLANNNNASCAIDKYGPNTPMAPGATPFTTTVTIKNVGTLKASIFTMAPGACTQSTAPTGGASDLCAKVNVKVYAGGTASGTALYNGTAAGFTSLIAGPVMNAGASQQYTFVVGLDAGAGNAYQGITITQPIVWTFQS